MSRVAAWILYYLLYRPSSSLAITLVPFALIAKSGVALVIAVLLSAFAPWIDANGIPEGIQRDDNPEDL